MQKYNQQHINMKLSMKFPLESSFNLSTNIEQMPYYISFFSLLSSYKFLFMNICIYSFQVTLYPDFYFVST